MEEKDEIRYTLSVPFYHQHEFDLFEIGETIIFVNIRGQIMLGEIVNLRGSYESPTGGRLVGLVVKYKKNKNFENFVYAETSLDHVIKTESQIKAVQVRYEPVTGFPLRT